MAAVNIQLHKQPLSKECERFPSPVRKALCSALRARHPHAGVNTAPLRFLLEKFKLCVRCIMPCLGGLGRCRFLFFCEGVSGEPPPGAVRGPGRWGALPGNGLGSGAG